MPLGKNRTRLIEWVASLTNLLDSDHNPCQNPGHSCPHKTPHTGVKDRHTLKQHVQVRDQRNLRQIDQKLVVAASCPRSPHTGSVNNSALEVTFDTAFVLQPAKNLLGFSLVWLVALSSYAEIAPVSHGASGKI
jgi:hypothetical protein